MHRISLSHDVGNWRLDGVSIGEACRFSDLADAIEYAREATGAAESLIELRVNGQYVCSIHQKMGWPQRIAFRSGKRAFPVAVRLSQLISFASEYRHRPKSKR
jgi:hypothetical protein